MIKRKLIALTQLAVISLAPIAAFADQAAIDEALANGSSSTPEPEVMESFEQAREANIAAILGTWGSVLDDVSQLESQLRVSNADEIAAAAQAQTEQELNAALLGTGGGELDNPQLIGDAASDWVYTAVNPCRIVDTRFQTAPSTGPIAAGGTREFNVHGIVSTQNGGPAEGNPTSCIAPGGEPRAVHANFSIVPVGAGNGNMRVYPSGTATPNASLINFKSGTVIANAGTIKTRNNLVAPDIEVFTSKSAHVIIDVLGYYYDEDIPTGVEYLGTTGAVNLSTSSSTIATAVLNAPTAGYVVVNASVMMAFSDPGRDLARCSITRNTTTFDTTIYHFASDAGGGGSLYTSMSQTRTYSVPSGNSTYRYICAGQDGQVQARDAAINAIFVPNKY